MKEKISIIWFRRDLRLNDNPALVNASKHKKVLPIYILDDDIDITIGSASKLWLEKSLALLSKSLNGNLSIYKGNTEKIFIDLLNRYQIEGVYWNRQYSEREQTRDIYLKKLFKDKNIKVESSNGALLWEPWTILKSDGTPYRVFTPFYRNGCLKSNKPRLPLPCPKRVHYIKDEHNSIDISKLKLSHNHTWEEKLLKHWKIGEDEAQLVLDSFIHDGLSSYKLGRNYPSRKSVSRLSPYIHFGEISPNMIWYALEEINDDDNIDNFRTELGWREFSYSQLYFNPTLQTENLQNKFNNFSWNEDLSLLKYWKTGQTGIPMVDAGMRELWETGYMHGRSRMIVGSFLVKNLRIDWKHGERWFWDTLFDADLASNSASWQWVAGCGLDAAPYFRIFNPITQGTKFDSNGDYIRKYIPELSKLPTKYLFSPWLAPEDILLNAKVKLGYTYPYPIVDLKKSREEALNSFKQLKR